MVFKNAILMKNTQIRSVSDGQSAIYLKNSNVFIGESRISDINSNNGAIYLIDTALQLHNNRILSNTEEQDGGGLYLAPPTIYDNYDVCLLLIENKFIENKAYNYGGAMYLNLIGMNNNRESCITLLDNSIDNNEANLSQDIYFNVSNGKHSILLNNTICNRNNNCPTMYSSIHKFCVATNLVDAETCRNNTMQIRANLSSNPGASETIYIFARDAFNNLIPTSDYNINVISSDEIIIINPNGARIDDEPYEYLIPILIGTGPNISRVNATVTIKDINEIAQDAIVSIIINDCDNTEYKYQISRDVYTCKECANGLYTLDSTICKTCPRKITCESNKITVKQNHHVSQEQSTDKTKGLQLYSVACPPGYCCNDKSGCDYNFGEGNLCGANRNASVRMCGACNSEYNETTSSVGNCRKCSAWEGKFMFGAYVVIGYLVVWGIFQISTSERTVPSPLQTYFNRTLLFYYQVLAFVAFRSYIPLLHTITDAVNLNLTINPEGACLYMNNVGPRQKLVMSLTVPAILLGSFMFTFARYYLKKTKLENDLIKREEGWWDGRVIAFANTFDVLVRILYLQLVYICLRLMMCAQYPDGRWYMWYAGEVQCIDAGQVTAAIFLFVLVVILPYIIYKIQLRYKYNNPERFEKLFATTILSYRQPCWYYGVVDLFRRAVIVVISISTYSSWMIVAPGALLVIHCTLMPYRWRVNNFLEIYVLSCIFLTGVVNDADLQEVIVGGIQIDFDPFLYVFAFLPLAPVPWLLYECIDWVKYKSLKIKIHDYNDDDEDINIDKEDIVYGFRCCCKKIIIYNGLNMNEPGYMCLKSTDEDTKKLMEGIDDNEEEYIGSIERQNTENIINKSNKDKIKGLSTISATPTRNGWKYPFKIKEIVCNKDDKDDVGDQSVTVDLNITFSHDIPKNTFIDSADLGQHISYWTQKLGSTIFINRVSGKGKYFTVEITAKWKNMQNLNKDLLEIGYELAMEEAIFNALDHNHELRKDLMKSFKIPPSKEDKEIKIVNVEIKGSLTDQDRNKFLIDQLLKQHSNKNENLAKELEQIKYLPLHKWTIHNLRNKIQHWILNDCKHKQTTKLLMDIFSKKLFTGKKIVSLGNELKIVLKNAIMNNEQIMTTETFEIIYENLSSQISDEDDKDKIMRNSAPQMALMISRIPLENILDKIDADQINGSKFIEYYDSDNEWIMEQTGWSQKEILQIETVLLKNKTYNHHAIAQKLESNLQQNLGAKIRDEFTNRCMDQSSEDYLDLEVLNLKLINGYPIDDEVVILTNIINDLLEFKNISKQPIKNDLNTITENNDTDDNKYDNNINKEFIPTIIKSIAACFATNVDIKELDLAGSTRDIIRQRSPSANNNNYQNQMAISRIKVSKQTDWTCSNCGNYNHKMVIGGILVSNWKECILCGVTELDSVGMACHGHYTYVVAARNMYDNDNDNDDDEIKQEDINDEEQNDDEECDRDKTINNKRRHKVIETHDNLEIMIADESTFDLRKIACPLKQSRTLKACKHVRNLAYVLRKYQNFIKNVRAKKGEPKLEKTVDVDLKQLKNEIFRKLVMECAGKVKQIKAKHKKELESILNEDIINQNALSEMARIEFIDEIVKRTTIKKGSVGRMYKSLLLKCKEAVQNGEYDGFVSELDYKSIDDDFFHVLNYHIKCGRQTKLDTFKYFKETVICLRDDCDSKSRKKDRIQRFKTKFTEEEKNNDLNNDNIFKMKEVDIFKLKQRYAQNNLDVMHYFLVHPLLQETMKSSDYNKLYNSKQDTVRSTIINQSDTFDLHNKSTASQISVEMSTITQINNEEKDDEKKETFIIKPDTHKYVTQIINNNDTKAAEYGFGVDHSYPHIKPKKNTNIRSELLFNRICKVRTDDFEDLLMRALKMQRIAVKEKKMRCKHYETEYNIVRNEAIGIRHILSIIVYTDMTEFCTAFRATYRSINKESDENVTRRHTELYFYSRALFEAVEFFGNSMEKKMKVYHGLSKVMMFERFTAYFNQPVSTTIEYHTALKFSQGHGIVLEFRRGGKNPSLIPKYLDVSWLSTFPEEDERLFYGDNIVFEIFDIIETKGNAPQKHKRELRILNMFQKMVKNQYVNWNRSNLDEYNKLKTEINDLVSLINNKISPNDIMDENDNNNNDNDGKQEEKYDNDNKHDIYDSKDMELEFEKLSGIKTYSGADDKNKQENVNKTVIKKTKISEYGEQLFDYFCNNSKTTWICINDYELIPIELKNALLYKNNIKNNDNQIEQLSFIKLLQLFGCLEKVVLNQLNVKQLTEQSKNYVKAVESYIKYIGGYKKNNNNSDLVNNKKEEKDEKDEKDEKLNLKSELKIIVFESVPEIDSKPNSTLHKLALKANKKFEKKNSYWTIEYQFLLEKSHTLTFKNNKQK